MLLIFQHFADPVGFFFSDSDESFAPESGGEDRDLKEE